MAGYCSCRSHNRILRLATSSDVAWSCHFYCSGVTRPSGKSQFPTTPHFIPDPSNMLAPANQRVARYSKRPRITRTSRRQIRRARQADSRRLRRRWGSRSALRIVWYGRRHAGPSTDPTSHALLLGPKARPRPAPERTRGGLSFGQREIPGRDCSRDAAK